jgi:tetratricopeptide (TPR) repeat protein
VLLGGLSKDLEDEAIGAFARATQLQPERADAWYEWARLLSERGDRDEALAHLRRAIAADATLREEARRDFPGLAELLPTEEVTTLPKETDTPLP